MTSLNYIWRQHGRVVRAPDLKSVGHALFELWAIRGQACKSYLDKLLKLQKRALRFIYFSDGNQRAILLFSDAGILPLQFSYYELTANLMFDIRHRNAPKNIRDLFQDISNIHSYNTQSSASHNFYTQNSRLSIQLNSFLELEQKFGTRCRIH